VYASCWRHREIFVTWNSCGGIAWEGYFDLVWEGLE